MPRGPTGVHTLPAGYQAIDGETILASQHNPPLEDISDSLTESLPRTGVAPMLSDLPLGGNKAVNAANATASTDLLPLGQAQSLFAPASAVVPSGLMGFWPSTTIPAGWLLCNGAAISRTTYAALFAVIGTTYGVGDGSTTFNLPQAGGEFIRVLDNGRGVDAGRTIGSAQADELKSHAHTASSVVTDPGHPHDLGDLNFEYGSIGFGTGFQTPSAGSGVSVNDRATAPATTGITVATTVNPAGGSETRPRNIAFNLIIKV